MKDIFKEIKEQSINKFTSWVEIDSSMVNSKGEMVLIHLLNAVENGLQEPKQILLKVAPEYDKKMLSADFQNLGKAFLNEKLELESRFYSIDRKTVELKIFVRKFNEKGKSTKVARASYVFHAEYNKKAA